MRLTPNERKIYTLLSCGRWFSTLGIIRALGISDPRGHLSSMRRKGVEIVAQWRGKGSGREYTRFKLYRIEPRHERERQGEQ